MSREILGKVKVCGTFVSQTPLSVGGLGSSEHVDLELAEDGQGRCYVPGTSLAGPMRAWMERHIRPEELVKNLFGYICNAEDDGQASVLYVSDSLVKAPRRERRHGIAILEDTGTTRENFLYTRALLPRGTRLPLVMELEILKGADAGGHPAGALDLLLEALQRGDIRFGACKTRGMGVLKLEDLTVDYYDFAGDPEALDLWLEGKSAAKHSLSDFPRPHLEEGRAFDITITWHSTSPLMVKSGRDGAEADMMPLMSGVEGGIAPVIPGTSLKGILRSQARKILDTLFNSKEPGEKGKERWDILSRLFGSQERAGRLMLDDVYCLPQEPISDEAWLDEDLETLNHVTERRQYVAIDRFTGGASDGALYSARPVRRDAKWGIIHLAVDFPEDEPQEEILRELALVKLLVRDMRDGFIPIGFGSRRGLGEIAVDSVDYGGTFPEDGELQAAWDSFIQEMGRDQ